MRVQKSYSRIEVIYCSGNELIGVAYGFSEKIVHLHTARRAVSSHLFESIRHQWGVWRLYVEILPASCRSLNLHFGSCVI
jgi:hypothetical protein